MCDTYNVGKVLRESIPRQVEKKSGLQRMRKGSGVLKVEIAVWGSQGEGKVWGSQGGGKDKLFFFSLSPHSLVLVT